MFNPDEPKFAKGVAIELPYPTDDTRLITKAAVDGLALVYRPGFAFSKAEVLLMDLRQPCEFTPDLFALVQSERASKTMAVMDAINARWGRGTVRPGGVRGAGLGDATGTDEPELYDSARSVVDYLLSHRGRP
ncbi:hypothetical protein D9M70_543290 [compost metagenome]